ncbi:MAG: DNA internalization-related competence protein ComEC/Rec2 [Desulfuromonas sp.]|nr:MAG: DNA internalization-related competence protein ComEC/Rec2 [Desulfuromonas sp.]
MHPLLPITFLISGLWLATLLDLSTETIWSAALICLLLAVCRQRHIPISAKCAGLFLGCGLLLYPLALNPTTQARALIDPFSDPVRFNGYANRVELFADRSGFVELEDLRIEPGGEPVPGLVRLFLDREVPNLLPGDRLHALAHLRTPRNFGTPGEFDYATFLASEGVTATGHLTSGEQIAVERRPDGSLNRSIAEWRQKLAGAIENAVPLPEGRLLQSLLLGQRHRLDPAQRRLLAASGVAHIFAISGLHLSLVALVCYQLLLVLYCRSRRLMLWSPPARVIPWLVLPLLYLFLLLTGAAISTQRAFLATALAIGIVLFNRQCRPMHLLATIGLFLLLGQPLQLFTPAFQLSFAGAAGLLMALPHWSRHTGKLPVWLRSPSRLFLASLAATVATTPFVLANFHIFAPAGLFNNLWAIPLIGCTVLPLGLLGLLCYLLCPGAAEFLWHVGGFLLHVGFGWLETMNATWFGAGRFVYLDPWQLTAIGLIAFTLLFMPRKSTSFCGLLVGIGLLFGCLPYPDPAGLSLTALSVGQGESLLLSKNGAHYLVDGGGLPYSKNFDVGERLLGPALGRLGVHRLDGIILTHNHPDHREGLTHILKTFPVARLLTAVPPSDLPAEWNTLLQRRQIRVEPLHPGWQDVGPDEGHRIDLFVPDQVAANLNDRSISIYAGLGSDGLLLTGDIEEEGIRQLSEAGIPEQVTLLKIPHHGSRSSNPGPLLEACLIREAVISCGYRNNHGHPHRSTLQLLQRHQVRLWRTDRDGTILLSSTGNGWGIKPWETPP